MQIIRDYQFVTPQDRGASVAIGNFDGVHIGHQSVIDLARKAAPDAPLGIMTFEPHPREYFAPDAPPFRLASAETRAHRLEKLGYQNPSLYIMVRRMRSGSLPPAARPAAEWFHGQLAQFLGELPGGSSAAAQRYGERLLAPR